MARDVKDATAEERFKITRGNVARLYGFELQGGRTAMGRFSGSPGPFRFLCASLAALLPPVPAGAGPEGQMTWAAHTTLVPSWFDPAENIHERAVFAPIWDFAFLHGVGPRVEESGLGLPGGYGFSAPDEDVKLKARRGPPRT